LIVEEKTKDAMSHEPWQNKIKELIVYS